MILGSLYDYYEILAANEDIPKPGYYKANVSYALNLSDGGELLGVIPLKVLAQRGKKIQEVPQLLQVPERRRHSSDITANFLCDNSQYVLGAAQGGKPERLKQCFEEFKRLHHEILDNEDCIPAKAVLSFLDGWRPEEIQNCAALADYLDELTSGANIVFSIAGRGFVHDNPDIRRAWERYCADSSDTVWMQCLITGEMAPVARVHQIIKGVKGAQPSGASIVSFNARAFESYGHDEGQGLNAPVSEYAAFAYTTALNHLLSDIKHKQFYGDTTVVYWAKSPQTIYRDIFEFSLNPVETGETLAPDKETEALIGSIFKKIVEGMPVGDFADVFDKDTEFYILGLSPNASRLSVRFFMKNTFGSILENVARHYRDLEIEHSPNDFEYLPLWKLMSETVSPKSKEKAASPLLAGAVMRSIISGFQYPQALFNNAIIRIRAEKDISRGKAAIIKAFLIRKNKNKYKEELTVALNEQSNNKAYVLGRLFAVLEKAQRDANPEINTTIKDRYFTSACTTPASVFPVLLRLANHHISKSEYGYVSERRIGDLMQKLNVDSNPFPVRLSLDDQGIFILGYYHQQEANYAKKEKEEN